MFTLKTAYVQLWFYHLYIYWLLIANVFWPETANILDQTKQNGYQTVCTFIMFVEHTKRVVPVLGINTRYVLLTQFQHVARVVLLVEFNRMHFVHNTSSTEVTVVTCFLCHAH